MVLPATTALCTIAPPHDGALHDGCVPRDVAIDDGMFNVDVATHQRMRPLLTKRRVRRRSAANLAASLSLALLLLAADQPRSTWVHPPSDRQRSDIPGLRHETFESRWMGIEVGYCVVLPPSYERDTARRYPVVYWLHGGGGNETTGLFTASFWSELYSRQGRGIREVILVYPTGYRSGYMDHHDGKTMVESMIVRELVPRIDATLRTVATRDARAVHGFSMGSSGALKLTIKYPDLFCAAVAGGGGAIDLEHTTDPWLLDILRRNLNSDPELIRQNNTYHFLEKNHAVLRERGTRFLLICGDADKWKASAVTFRDALLAKELPCELSLVPGVGHNARRVYEAKGVEAALFQDAVFARTLQPAAVPDSPEPPRPHSRGPAASGVARSPKLTVRQITTGPRHHFFGYIGHVGTIPWNASGRYIAALRTSFQDHMPGADEPADIVLLDTKSDYNAIKVDETRGWNPQQGTMLYWNPDAAETQFFFNDRDRRTGHIFTVLYDVEKRVRVREYRFDDTPVANSGVAQSGGSFLAINYARMARLRPVTGYAGAPDWTQGVFHPEDDGIYRVDIEHGTKHLLVSFAQLRDALARSHPFVAETPLFINHTLWNRDGNQIFFFARGGWRQDRNPGERKINASFLMRPDGTALVRLKDHIGGHPEWESGQHMIGALGDDQVLYDTETQRVVKTLGTRELLPRPGGDIALSPDGSWLVNGYRVEGKNRFVLLRLADGFHLQTKAFDQHGWTSGELRNDPAPCWNRDGTQILFPSIADDQEHTRQLFLLRIESSEP